MDIQIIKDNPGVPKAGSAGSLDRVIMYGGYAICMVLAYVAPRWSMRGVGIITIIIVARITFSRFNDTTAGEE